VTVTYAPPAFALVRNEVFDGHLRVFRQVLDDSGELPVQFFGFLCVRFFPTAASIHVIREQTTEA